MVLDPKLMITPVEFVGLFLRGAQETLAAVY